MTRILIVRLGSLGDVIHAIPAAAALRAHFPAARIDWVTDPRYVALLALVRGVDRRIGINTREIGGALSAIGSLRRERYDAAIDFQGLLKSAVLARSVGAGRTIGFPSAHVRESLAAWFYTQTADPGVAPHVIFRNLALLASLGVRDSRVEFPLEIPRSAAAEQVAADAGAAGYVLLNPGAAWPNKRWPAQRFGALAADIRMRFGLPSFVLWGPGEEPLAAAVAAHANSSAHVAPPTSVADLFALAQGARLMVSGDTGPLHIAAAVGTPIVCLFGPTRPERNGPWSAADVTCSRVDQCSCHYERRCRREQPCIDSIPVDEVVSAVERRLVAHG